MEFYVLILALACLQVVLRQGKHHHCGLVPAWPARVTLESSAVPEAIERPIAARALKALGPADLSQSFLTLGFRSVELRNSGP